MSDHTPGPWTIGRFPQSDDRVYISGRTWQNFAEVCSHASGFDQPEAAANARLIAAAPELLAAVRAFVQWDEGNQSGRALNDAIRTARAALARAEG